MSGLRRNIAANAAGKGWSIALGLVFPPVYARLLGIESYGLVGVWTSLNAILGVLDLGLSTTLNREMARYSTEHTSQSYRKTRDLVCTIEVVFWMVGIAAGAAIALLASTISNHWVNAEHLSNNQVTSSIQLIGVLFALQWPLGVYNGGLLGLQRQVTANVVQVVFQTIRSVGAVIVLWKVQHSIHAFFLWQAVTTGAQTLATRTTLAATMPGPRTSGKVRWSLLMDNWRFSAGMTVLALLSIVLTQTDKVIVSKLLSLEQLGYYTLAWTVGGALANLVNPVFIAIFPRLSQLVKQEQVAELSRLYHASSQLVACFVLPAAATLALFSREVLIAWSGDPRIVSAAAPVVTVVALGVALNALMNVPYALMLAFGWTRLNVMANLIAVLTIAPLEYVVTRRYGLVGAATGFLVLNSAYVLVLIPIMHRRLLVGEHWRWYFVDVATPLVGLAVVLIPLRVVLRFPGTRLGNVVCVMGIAAAGVAAAIATTPEVRKQALALLLGRRPHNSA